jgi:hypothetical protein
MRDLRGEDLAVLRDVCEGWYVDYKVQCLPAQHLAKHMSAFANQFGGWLFLGIDEDSAKQTAGAFPGIALDDLVAAQSALRIAASAHTSPDLFFSYVVIEGPVPDIGLAEDRAIVVVHVPAGPNPPYIHRTGRIYRRVGDSSEPKPETDRAVLDQLTGRARRSEEALTDFLGEIPVLSKGEVPQPRSYTYFLSDPYFAGPENDVGLSEFAAVMQAKEASFFSVSFDNIQPTADGFVARHVADNNPQTEVLTFRWWHNGNARISLPFGSALSPRSERAQNFARECVAKGYTDPDRFVDITPLLPVLVSSMNKFLRLREMGRFSGEIYQKSYFRGFWRRVPFLDDQAFIDNTRCYGIPAIQDDCFFAPQGSARASFVRVDPDQVDKQVRTFAEKGPELSNAVRSTLSVSLLADFLFAGLGIPLRQEGNRVGDLLLRILNVRAKETEGEGTGAS